MPKPKNPKPPYPAAFRQQMVDLVATGRRPSELAKEFGCHETSILSWVRIARAATPPLANLPPTLHESERAELLALRKENRQIKMERYSLRQRAWTGSRRPCGSALASG
jgi:transposase